MGHSDETLIWGDKEEECGGLYSSQDFQSNHSFQANQTVCDQDYLSKRIRLFPEADHQEGEEDGSIGEASPLGLTLTKSASFLSLVQNRLRKGKHAGDEEVETKKMEELGSQEKMKASNFPAYYIRIGSWQRMSMHEGDVTAKLYYAKRKLVWEVLEGGLKSKIEIQWSDITAIRGVTPEHECGTLEIELKQPPVFYRELNPQPRKHTLWQQSCDFTGGQAPIWRRHYLRFPPGILDKPYHKLLHCDQRLHHLSRNPFPTHASPYFDPTIFGISQLSLLINNASTTTYPNPTMPSPILPLPVVDYGVGNSSTQFPSWDQGFISQQQPTPVAAESMSSWLGPTDLTPSFNPQVMQQFAASTANYNTTEALYPQQLNWQLQTDDANLFMGHQVSHGNSFFFPDINPTTGGGGGAGAFF